MPDGQLPALRITVAELVRYRDEALRLYGCAYDALESARQAIDEAHKTKTRMAAGTTGFNYGSSKHLQKCHLTDFNVPSREFFETTVRRAVDSDCWSRIIEITALEQLMDKTAKDDLRRQLVDDPPDITEENVIATIEQLFLDRDTIFKRGIATCFSKLDRRFRSHDGWKIGNRVILDRCFDEWGTWNHYSNMRDTLIDIERTFRVLDDERDNPAYSQLLNAIETARRNDGHSLSPRQTEVDSEYFKIRIFKNGNCHVWFQRDDLVERVNKLLAEYYGDVIPEERSEKYRKAAEEEDSLFKVKRTPAKGWGFYPTPEDAAEIVMRQAKIWRPTEDRRPLLVLEPSAGNGSLAYRAVENGGVVDCVEIQTDLAAELDASGKFRKVTCGDFLDVEPKPIYDRVVMNPPFDLERDIDHVLHAMKFLNPNGYLISIMSAGTEFRMTKKSVAFRKLLDEYKARMDDLPPGSFLPVGTNVNTVIVCLNKDKSFPYR